MPFHDNTIESRPLYHLKVYPILQNLSVIKTPCNLQLPSFLFIHYHYCYYFLFYKCKGHLL